MIDFVVAGALQEGMVILLPWPGWAWRRFHVTEVKTTGSGDFVMATCRGMEGIDDLLDVHIARGALEPVHVISRNQQDNESIVESLHEVDREMRQRRLRRENKKRSRGDVEYRFPDPDELTDQKRIRNCTQCKRAFVRPVRPGKPPEVCSSECAKARREAAQ